MTKKALVIRTLLLVIVGLGLKSLISEQLAKMNFELPEPAIWLISIGISLIFAFHLYRENVKRR